MGTDMNNLYELVIRGKYKKINQEIYSKELNMLIDMCLQTDPKMRLGCKEILELEWVKGML
jgi:serine/threonine protein kinase